MSKRNITFTKPEPPSFLRKLKAECGYKEGPTVETKREAREAATADDFEDREEDQPTVVVLQAGDLTAEEADDFNEKLKQEEEETPADLTKPIVFVKPTKTSTSKRKTSKRSLDIPDSEEKTKKVKNKSLLSFDDDLDE